MNLTTNTNSMLCGVQRLLVTFLFLFLAQQGFSQYVGTTQIPNQVLDAQLTFDVHPAWASQFPEGNLEMDIDVEGDWITAYYYLEYEPETTLILVGTAQVLNLTTGEVQNFNITFSGGVIDVVVINL